MSTMLKVVGLLDTIEAARKAGDEAARAPLREIRRELTPLRKSIRRDFAELGGVGPEVARSVSTVAGTRGVGVRMGGRKYPFAPGREFGAKRMQTRAHFRRVQSGAYTGRRVGGGVRTTVIARIPYASDAIFGSWTGNQFDIGQSGGRLVLGQVSGRAFYPNIGAGAENIYNALEQLADKWLDQFPPPATQNTTAALAQFFAAAGLDY